MSKSIAFWALFNYGIDIVSVNPDVTLTHVTVSKRVGLQVVTGFHSYPLLFITSVR